MIIINSLILYASILQLCQIVILKKIHDVIYLIGQ